MEPAVLNSDGGDSSAPDVSYLLKAINFKQTIHLNNCLFLLRFISNINCYNFVFYLQGFSFQIGYCETDDQLPGRSLPQYTLYLVASNEKERTEWIAAIRAGKKNLFFILLMSLFR